LRGGWRRNVGLGHANVVARRVAHRLVLLLWLRATSFQHASAHAAEAMGGLILVSAFRTNQHDKNLKI
jgi:hypothetical protein